MNSSIHLPCIFLFNIQTINPSGAEDSISREKKVSIMAADVLGPDSI